MTAPPTAEAEELASSSVAAVAAAEPDAAARADAPPDVDAEAGGMAAAAAVGAAATHAVTAASRFVTVAMRRFSDPEPSDETPTPWAPLESPVPMLAGRPYQRHVSLVPDPTTWDAALASAYRPSTLTLSSAAAFGPGPGSSSGASISAAHPAALAEAMGADAVQRASRLMVIDAAKLIEIAGWFVVVGATMSLLGFLLPWSRVVIGASGRSVATSTAGGWPARPTSSSSSGLLAVLALGIRRRRRSRPGSRRPASWVSRFGGLLIGLAWPYLVGPLGADVGVTVIALGGLALRDRWRALRRGRHVTSEPEPLV